MKNLFFTLLIGIIGLNFQANAQEMRGKPAKGEMLQKMQEKLSLTDSQVAQIKAIDEKYENREEDLRSRMQKIKEEHQALKSEKKAEVDKVLTAEQREKIKAWKEERKEKRKVGPPRMNK